MANTALEEVVRLASILVLETPHVSEDKRKYTPSARIRRDLIEQLEVALVVAGVDLNAARTRMKAIIKQQAAA